MRRRRRAGSGRRRARRRLDSDGAVGEWRCRAGGSLRGRLNAWSYNCDIFLSRDCFGSAIVAR